GPKTRRARRCARSYRSSRVQEVASSMGRSVMADSRALQARSKRRKEEVRKGWSGEEKSVVASPTRSRSQLRRCSRRLGTRRAHLRFPEDVACSVRRDPPNVESRPRDTELETP